MSDMLPHRRPNPGRSPFDDLRHVDEDPDGNEFEWWSAREMMAGLGYERWENLENVIRKAKTACRNTNHAVEEHFRDVTKNPSVRGGAPRKDVQVSRFGAYLVAMNGDPDKPEIAAAQRYFAIQTRIAETRLAEATPLPRPWSERISLSFQQHRLEIVQRFPRGSFSVYTATGIELMMIEDELLRHRIPVQRKDLPDGSIGQRWATHCRTAGHQPLGRAPLRMDHILVGGEALVVEPYVYDADVRPFFEEWFHAKYVPVHMPDYFGKKKEWRHLRLPAASAADNASLRLTGFPAELGPLERRAIRQAGGFIPAARSLDR